MRIRTASLGLVLLLGACPDASPTPVSTDGSSTSDGGSSTSDGTACEPGEARACACEDGGMGMQTCAADGSGFAACECEGADSTATTEPPDSTTDTDTTTTTSGPVPTCDVDADCEGLAEGECEVALCNDLGLCMVQHAAAGTPCGDASETECSQADTCDGRGQCSANDAGDGTTCSECPQETCACAAGACGDCAGLAPGSDFNTTRSIAGWTLTGGWGLYRATPQSYAMGPTVFASQVLGTDGNRAAPYPGSHGEQSAARSATVVLPASLELSSWHVDEGSDFDTKQVRVSNDGGATFVTLVDCATAPASQPFCEPREDPRAPDDWDAISIAVPSDMVGDLGLVEFTYDTGDGCCGFEKGWFIDATNFASECACASDEGCSELGGACGAGACGADGQCELVAVAAGTACGDATGGECDAPDACDGLGYCASNEAATGLTDCEDCPAGAGNCNVCQAGECVDCLSQADVADFDGVASVPAGWLVEDLSGGGADWRVFTSAPPNNEPGSLPVALSLAPSFGSDGNRQTPYPGGEVEHSRITTTPDIVPAVVTFASWNVDEGSFYDTKLIEISVNGGASWSVLVDCSTGIGTQPFCSFRDASRLGNDWDAIVLDTAAYEGQTGQLRFTYDTVDACCGFERGWFIDDLSFAQLCADSPFP